MKRLFIIIVVLNFAACDKFVSYDYFITNICNEDIEVKIEVKKDKIKNPKIQISPNETQLIHSDEWFQPLNDRMIESFFEAIIITKGTDTSKVNYINKDLWDFKKTSKNHASSYLTVKPEDFE